MLRVSVLSEFQNFGGSIGVERHCVDVLVPRRGQRGRRTHGADLYPGISKELRHRLNLSCKRVHVPILGLISDTGKTHRHRQPGRFSVDGPQGCREAFLVCRQSWQLGFLSSSADGFGYRLPRGHLVQPRSTRSCCERRKDASQQQRPTTGHADRLNGLPPYFFGSVSLAFGRSQLAPRRNRPGPIIDLARPRVAR
jgi:hypothetical protein